MNRGKLITATLVVTALVHVMPSAADAQLFGRGRQMGTSLSAPGMGSVRSQRFVRGARGHRSFVGRSMSRRFVGSEQARASGSVSSSVAGVSTGRSASQVNLRYQPSDAGRPYDPRLAPAFDYPQIDDKQVEDQLNRQLRSMRGSVEVSVAGRTATLRGEVASEEDRQLAEILTSFEPAISDVRNELQVAGDGADGLPIPRPQK